jgi:hypothetical protein
MFFNSLAVVRKHANAVGRESRRRLLKRGQRFVYRYAFSQILAAAKHGLRHGDLSPLRNLPGPAVELAKLSISDPQLLWWFLRDLRPRRWALR